LSPPAAFKEFAVPRVVSFIVLLAILLLLGAMFFQVMAKFVVPLFLASVLVVVFKPLHIWVREKIPGHPRLSALTTTLLILLVALLPTAYLGWNAYIECRSVFAYLKQPENQKALTEQLKVRAHVVTDFFQQATGIELDLNNLPESVSSQIGTMLISSVQTIGWMLVGVAIMLIALYYFFLDGPNMIAGIMRMSPLEDEYERELLDKFANISRAVVVASLASAVAQGLLAGIGFYFALNAGAPIFLLMMVTMVLAIVPFVGAAAVWIPTAFWIYVFQTVEVGGQVVPGDAVSGIGLAIYGACVISTIDNVIKPLVLHGQSNLHPLLALLSVLGGVQVLGPIGILVGPMLVAFFQALVNMVNKELLRFGNATLEAKRGARAAPLPLGAATVVEAEAAVAGSWLGKVPVADDETGDAPDSPSSRQLAGSPKPPVEKRRRRRK
jgi:predicted PurR-regulated permease PerM